MPRFTVGCVPYVNAIPLVWWFEHLGDDSPVKVLYDVPSKLPALLESGQADAILVSSIDALRTPGRKVADGVCIGSEGPVQSVRLFSRVPYGHIEKLALDASSMTSNRLAQILLAENFNARPETLAMPPDVRTMLDVCEACVLIGDIGMTAEYPGARILDLGQAWTDATHHPFVWALWTGRQDLDPELVSLLTLAYRKSKDRQGRYRPEVIHAGQANSNWPPHLVEQYYNHCIRFDFDPRAKSGLGLYRQKLLAHGHITDAGPVQVASSSIR